MAAEEIDRARHWGAASSCRHGTQGESVSRSQRGSAEAGAAGGAVAATGAAAGAGVGNSAMDLLREAADMLRASPAKLEYARTLADLGAALRRANRRPMRAACSIEAIELARRCGAGALVERAGVELRASGGRSSDAAVKRR